MDTRHTTIAGSALKNLERLRRNWRASAQKRRRTEAALFRDLQHILPVPRAKTLDKVALLRLATNYMRLRELVAHFEKEEPCVYSGVQFLRDEFLIVLVTNGDIVYLSEGGAAYLQRDKHKLIGTSFYDHVRNSYWGEVDQLLSVQSGDGGKTTRTRAAVKLVSGQELQITGRRTQTPSGHVFIGHGEPQTALTTPSPVPILATIHTIATLDMKAVWMDPRGEPYMGYSNSDIAGLSCFQFMHPGDQARVRENVFKLLHNSDAATSYGRMLVKGGGWAWIVTHARKVRVQVRLEDGGLRAVALFVARHFMVSEVHERGEVMALVQIGGTVEHRDKGPLPTDCWDEDELDELLRFIE